MLIEVHMLKNYPPVNLNRDETGSPKTCLFGGVQRGRISSQCLKRSWRTSEIFQNLNSSGIRTRKLPEEVKTRLIEMGVDPRIAEEAKVKLTGIANKDGKTSSDGKTAQIIFYSREEIDAVARKVKEIIDEDGSLKVFQKRKAKDFAELFTDLKLLPVSADIALFGRMVTSENFLDIDASMQVAHAISTHGVNRESDFYTAMDDLLRSEDEAGAGMMGDIDYNSCCYYEYASVSLDSLRSNLSKAPDPEDLIRKIIPSLLRAMAFSNPSGKQNTFAGHVMPDLFMIECCESNVPMSYVNAFETPVPAWGRNPEIVKNSVERLAEYADCMDSAYSIPLTGRGWFAPRFPEIHPANCETFDKFQDLIDACGKWALDSQG